MAEAQTGTFAVKVCVAVSASSIQSCMHLLCWSQHLGLGMAVARSLLSLGHRFTWAGHAW